MVFGTALIKVPVHEFTSNLSQTFRWDAVALAIVAMCGRLVRCDSTQWICWWERKLIMNSSAVWIGQFGAICENGKSLEIELSLGYSFQREKTFFWCESEKIIRKLLLSSHLVSLSVTHFALFQRLSSQTTAAKLTFWQQFKATGLKLWSKVITQKRRIGVWESF